MIAWARAALLGMDVPTQNPELAWGHIMLDHRNVNLHLDGEGNRWDASCIPFYIQDLLSPFLPCSV